MATSGTSGSLSEADGAVYQVLEEDLRIPASVEQLLDRVERFYVDHVKPVEEALRHRFDDQRLYLDKDGKLHPEILRARRHVMRASAEEGLYSLHLPAEIGGGDLGREAMFYVEEKVYSYGVRLNPAILGWTDGPTPRLLYADDEQRQRFVEPLVRGEKTSLQGITEAGAGSSLMDMRTTAIRRGDDWVLNGAKAFITNAFDADVAQICAVTDPGKGRHSFSYFIFDVEEHLGRGYSTGRVLQTMFGDGFTGELVLEDLVLPGSALLGERGQGFEIALASINWTRLRRGGMCSGWSRRLIEQCILRANTRVLEGEPLGSKQGIQWKIADMYLDWLQARSLSLEVARHVDSPGPWYRMPRPSEEIRKISAMKVSCDESFYRVADTALQIHGATGVLRDTEVNKLFQIARNLRIPGGADEVQRTTIAETLGLGSARPARSSS